MEEHNSPKMNDKFEDILLKANDIRKNYGPIVALDGVNLEVRYNEIIGLVGDNGAGKSTFIKILAGYYRPDKGTIYFKGRKVEFNSPYDARREGIEIVYQDLALIPSLPIYRNIFLAFEEKKGPFLNKKFMIERSKKFLESMGINVDVNIPATELSGGQRQMVAIARALMFKANLLLLDEPTSALSVYEAKQVLDFVSKAIKETYKGKASAIVVSHNIYHIYAIATRIVVMDQGKIVLDIPSKEMSPSEIEEYIVQTKLKRTSNVI